MSPKSHSNWPGSFSVSSFFTNDCSHHLIVLSSNNKAETFSKQYWGKPLCLNMKGGSPSTRRTSFWLISKTQLLRFCGRYVYVILHHQEDGTRSANESSKCIRSEYHISPYNLKFIQDSEKKMKAEKFFSHTIPDTFLFSHLWKRVCGLMIKNPIVFPPKVQGCDCHSHISVQVHSAAVRGLTETELDVWEQQVGKYFKHTFNMTQLSQPLFSPLPSCFHYQLHSSLSMISL